MANMNCAPLMRPETISNLFRIVGKRMPMYRTVMVDELVPEPKKNDPAYVCTLASMCIQDELGNQADKAINLIIQAAFAKFIDGDKLTLAESVAKVKSGIRAVWPTLSTDNQIAIIGKEQVPDWVANPEADFSNDAMLKVIEVVSQNPDRKAQSVQVFTSAVLAYCKQGNASNYVRNKVTMAIKNEMNLTIHLDPNVIHGVWSVVSTCFDDSAADDFFAMWERSIGEGSLRLRLLVQQAGWTAMMNYQNIFKARDMFPTFKWAKLAAIISQDFANFNVANQTINGNKYYGYKSDLGNARSTLYPTLSFCAYELLVSVGGDRSLKGFLGSNRNVPKAAAVEKMVRDFETEYRAQLTENVEPDEDAAILFRQHVMTPIVP